MVLANGVVKSFVYNILTEKRTDGLHGTFYNYCKLYIGKAIYTITNWFYFTQSNKNICIC